MARIGQGNRGVMITEASARRIARVVSAFDRDPRVVMRSRPLRTAGDDADDAIKIGKTVAAIDRLSAGDVDVYGPPPADDSCAPDGCQANEFSATGEKICAQNLIEDIAANEWVYLLKPSGGTDWHIIGRAATQSDDQEDDCGQETINAVQLTFEACNGSGAKAHATVADGCPGGLASVVIDNAGSGYAVIGRSTPEFEISGAGGSGAEFTVTCVINTDACGIPFWSISNVMVSGGTGYRDDATLKVRPQEGTVIVECPKLVIQTGSGGVPNTVTVEQAGAAYKEDPAEDPWVDAVTVSVNQSPPSAGWGAVFEVEIDEDPSSESFGSIIGVTITSPGDNYVGEVHGYKTLWNQLDFATITNYDGSKPQMLGHAAGGCLEWFDVTDCEPETTGVCCIGGEISEHTTQAACEAAEGTWKPGASAGDLPGPCCP